MSADCERVPSCAVSSSSSSRMGREDCEVVSDRCWHSCDDRVCDSYLQLRFPSEAAVRGGGCGGGGGVSRAPSPGFGSQTSLVSRFRTWPGGRFWRLLVASKTLCAVSVTLAFVLGILIGVLVPLYYVASSSSNANSVSSLASAADVVVANGGVSFATPASPRAPQLDDGGGGAATRWRRLVEGVYWTDDVEAALPTGFSDGDVASWRALTNHTPIVRMEEGCGRMQNRLVVFERGARSCARYRQNMDQIQGEIFSFYLSRILGMGNVPPASLDVVEATGRQWDRVRPELTLAQWIEQRPVVMTQWVDGLEPAHIPGPFRPSSRHLHPPDVNLQAKGLLDEEGQRELKDLAQWSDLVIFDYLTANLDRVVNNLYNMQWNTGMMDAPAHNLARQTATGLLVFLDNESGLLHGFRLLDKYEPYHRKLLDSLCVFRRSTVENLEKLSRSDVATEFSKRVSEAHPDMSDALPPLPDKYARILAERIRTVLNHVRGCERIYDSS